MTTLEGCSNREQLWLHFPIPSRSPRVRMPSDSEAQINFCHSCALRDASDNAWCRSLSRRNAVTARTYVVGFWLRLGVHAVIQITRRCVFCCSKETLNKSRRCWPSRRGCIAERAEKNRRGRGGNRRRLRWRHSQRFPTLFQGRQVGYVPGEEPAQKKDNRNMNDHLQHAVADNVARLQAQHA